MCSKSGKSLDVKIVMDECPAERLPLEVVIYLMGFLTYSDRVAASQVCQMWYEASLHPKFVNQEKVVIKKAVSDSLSTFKNSLKSYFHLMLIEIEVTGKMNDFWLHLAPDLKSLYFGNCDIYERTLVDVLSTCFNLETLVLHDCRELFMPGRLLDNPEDAELLKKSLSKLKELSLSSNRYVSDAVFNRLTCAMPHLESISLENCQMSFHPGLIKKFYPDRLIAENPHYASETVLTFWNLFKFLNRKARQIKSINLCKTLIDSTSLTQISKLDNLELSELHVAACEQLTNAAIISLTQHQRMLTTLDVSYCSRITDQALLHICYNLNSLEKLAVRNCRAVTDLGIAPLKNLTNLQELDISQCEQVTGEGIEEALCGTENQTLRKLVMEGLSTITSGTVILLAESLPMLTHLNLSYCFNAVNDSSVQAIFHYQTKLRSLRIANCSAVTDAGLTGMGSGASDSAVDPEGIEKAVQNLMINQPGPYISLRSKAEEQIIQDAYRKQAVQKLCETQLTDNSCVGYSLARLKGLQELDLRCCNKITDVSLKYSFRFVELQHLNLSQCQQITAEGLLAVGRNNPSIDTLSLGQCYNISDEGIAAITRYLHRLKYLDIKGCNQLSENSVIAIVENCQQLRYLDASHCKNMADTISMYLHKLPVQTFFTRQEERIVPPFPAPPLLR